MKRLAIIGSGDLAHQIAYHALSDGHYIPIGFFDDFEKRGVVKHNLPVLGNLKQLIDVFNADEFDVLMIGIGYKHFNLRAEVFNNFKDHIPFGSIVHSSSFVDESCQLGSGIFIYPGCVLDMNVKIGNNVLINVGCNIAHDSSIGDHCFLSPSVKIAGFVTIGQKVSLGIGTILIDNLKINDNVRTGAGSVVIKDMEKPGLYVGVPANFKKE